MDDSIASLKSIQKDLYELMCPVHAFCEENGIAYSLTGGSLLGAIRHNGFIPWDDDLDIMLTRDNFEKFREIYYQKKPAGFVFERDQWVYRIRRVHREKGYVPSIDFFIIDSIPDSGIKRKVQLMMLKTIQGLLRTNEKEGEYSAFYRFLISFLGGIGKRMNKEKLFAKYDRISQWGNSNSSQLAIFNDKYRLLGLRYEKILVDGYEKHTFEQSDFSIIKNYDHYLTKQFGDYMKLPDEKDRIPRHIF